MSDNEFLLAISEMLDMKLDAKLKPIENDIQIMKSEISTIKSDIFDLKVQMSDMESEMSDMKGRMSNVENEISELKDEMSGMKGEISSMEDEMSDMKGEISSMEGRMSNMETEIHQVKLFQENIILPRLNTIEACYVDTYKRYKNNADKMEDAFTDIALMKKVITEHSEKLQRLA